ncbi:ATP synthase subunit d mitochondrial [Fasciolopsis buskii]|uniref:ATP synthase subunit d, mitochondrial n=1 Tax=Fasciolopsis buskii TaxID=27845 RepID=A0A8E0VG29_9TREM|nr:ATP synthase subunit d mitochondrial [Fasciolopsis buski]
MASRRVARSAVNWVELQKRCPKHQLDQFRDFKTRIDGVVSKISSLPDTLPPINWDAYAQTVPIPGLVARFQKEYESLQVEYPKDVLNVKEKVQDEGEQLLETAKRHMAACEKMKDSANKMKSAVSKLPKLDELIPEVTLAYFPLTNLDPFKTGEVKKSENKTILKSTAPKMHWNFN